jgi:hypothetical protein
MNHRESIRGIIPADSNSQRHKHESISPNLLPLQLPSSSDNVTSAALTLSVLIK